MSDKANSDVSPVLSRLVTRAAGRVRLLRARRFGADGLSIGSLISAILLLTFRLLHYEAGDNALWRLVVSPALGLFVGAIYGLLRPIPTVALLRLIEQRLDLKERLSTAHELRGGDGLERLQVFDAENHANVDIRPVLPFWPVPRRVWVAFAAPLAVFLLWYVPTLPAFQTTAQKAEKAAVKKEGERLVRLAKALERDATGKKLDKTGAAAKKLEQLGGEMEKGRLDRKKALMKAAKLTDEIKRQQQILAAEEAPKSLSGAAKEWGKSLAAQSANSGAESGAASAQNDANLKPDGDANDKSKGKNANAKSSPAQNMRDLQKALAKSDVSSLADKLSRLAEQVAQGKPADKAEREKLAKQLESLSKALEGTKLSEASQSLKDAANALKSGEMNTASEKLRDAARKAQQSAKNSADADSLQQMADAMSNPDAHEGAVAPDSGEGQGANDAFSESGAKKGASETQGVEGPIRAREGQQGENGYGGTGKDGKARNGIGSEAGKLGGKKPQTEKGGAYLDARDAPENNKNLKNPTLKANVRDDKFARIYAPDGKNPNTRVKGQRGDKGKETVTFMKSAPGKADASTPYYEVYEKYAPAAEEAVKRDDIPANYRRQVREYFDSLKPKP